MIKSFGFIFLVGSAHASIDVEAPPIEGLTNRIYVFEEGEPSPGETVTIVYRPGIVGEQEIAIGITDGLGAVRWTPARGGVATVHAGDQEVTLNISRSSLPASLLTLIALLIALSFGSAYYGYRQRKE